MKSTDKQYSQHLRYQPLRSGFYENVRESLKGRLPANCVAFLASSQQVSTNADGICPFIQESNLFYLTGIDQPSVRLMLYPDHPDEEYREVLFLERGNAETQRWDGPLLDFGQASAISGIANVQPLDEFEKIARAAIIQSDSIGLWLNEHPRKNLAVSEAGRWLLEWCGTHFPQHPHFRLYGPMRDMRMVKRPEEIEQIRQACDNICEGFSKALKFIRPGVFEFEIQAELMAHIMRNRSRRFSFDPIVASGGNSCILHYSKNNSMCKDGDLLLTDIGSEYGNYNSDITRVIPVNGRFSPRQREILSAVLRIQRSCISSLRVGTTFAEYQAGFHQVANETLLSLGLLGKEQVGAGAQDPYAHRKYTIHNPSHHLGLDVHDVSSQDHTFCEGMVLTVEPGIYLPEENIGIRLEDDVVIGKDGVTNLTEKAPIEADHIEDLMDRPNA